MGGWLDQVGIRLSQLSTKLKLKLKLNLAKTRANRLSIINSNVGTYNRDQKHLSGKVGGGLICCRFGEQEPTN